MYLPPPFPSAAVVWCALCPAVCVVYGAVLVLCWSVRPALCFALLFSSLPCSVLLLCVVLFSLVVWKRGVIPHR